MLVSTWVELIQHIQLFGVYLFLPVIWKGKLLEALYLLNTLGEYIHLKQPIILTSDMITSQVNSNSSPDNKLEVYFPSRLLNLVYPISSLLLMTVLIAHGLVFLLTLFLKSSQRLRKACEFLNLIKWYVLEMFLVRVFFMCLVNLESYFKSGA